MMGAVPVASTPLVRRTRGRLSPRPKGSGGIVEVRPGVWRIDLEVGRDPVTGRRRRVSRRVRGSRVDAEAALAKLRVSADERRLPQRGTSARTVRAVLERYVADAESGVVELAPKTVVTTRSACSTISATVLDDGRVFGDLTLASLGWADIESLYRVMRATGQSAATVRRKATVLATALDRARKHGLIDHNPARDASRPKTVRSKPYSPGRDEVMAVLDRARVIDPEIADGALLLAATGMRMGELLGLQVADLDLRAGQVVVCWSITDGGTGVGVLRKPTKRSDWRDVPLTAGAIAAFRRQLERSCRRFDVEAAPTHYVFPGPRGPDDPHRPDSFGDRWFTARGASDITFLHLRHFAATAMLDAGEDYRTVADILGNSETTLRMHYDGRTNLDKRRAVSALEL